MLMRNIKEAEQTLGRCMHLVGLPRALKEKHLQKFEEDTHQTKIKESICNWDAICDLNTEFSTFQYEAPCSI